ncbi:MAG: hypothetical protein CL458_08410 [Acidimicrobiaceae bacterium]|nr:hypothetical protein [Acidimicrobiaceae bacterium]|tara:strand:+ start:32395 stop:33255 length:861 start_codon:yes stop_codon:yes gene_type:complete
MSSIARQMWEATERYHQLCYWAPEVREEGSRAGLKGFWMNYFATRVAPLGPVNLKAVESLFFYYAPQRIERAIPDAWSYATPEAIIEARYRGMDQALKRELGPLVESEELLRAAEIIKSVVQNVDGTGRTLFTGWNSLPWPNEPHLALWHGCTALREHRSGCHLMALAVNGLDGPQSVITQVAVDEAPSEWIQHEAGWSDDDVATATAKLRDKGWLDDQGRATEICYQGRRQIEELTDQMNEQHWVQLGTETCDELSSLLNMINKELPKDDQIDWREIYESNETQN